MMSLLQARSLADTLPLVIKVLTEVEILSTLYNDLGTEISQPIQVLGVQYNDLPGTRPHGSSRRATTTGCGKGGMTLAGSVGNLTLRTHLLGRVCSNRWLEPSPPILVVQSCAIPGWLPSIFWNPESGTSGDECIFRKRRHARQHPA